jgi:hypothetical protein
MKSLSRDMQRLRAELLRKSGFQDLEGRDPDGPLSDRGNLHVVTEGGRDDRLDLVGVQRLGRGDGWRYGGHLSVSPRSP